MKTKRSVAVVGAGAGGLVAAAYLAKEGHEVTLFESGEHVGGCASCFSLTSFRFLAGATTLVGLEPSMPLGTVFRELGFVPNATPLQGAITVDHRDHQFALSGSTEENAERLSELYEAPLGTYWKQAIALAERAWTLIGNAPFPPRGARDLFSLATNATAWKTLPSLLRSANSALRSTGATQSQTRELLDELLLISTQANAKQTPFLFASIGLEYLQRPFFLASGGLGGLLEDFAGYIIDKLGVRSHRKCRVTSMRKENGTWILTTGEDTFKADAVVLNLTHWDAARLVEGNPQKAFRATVKRHPDAWSACCLYLGVKDIFSDKETPYHQLLLPKPMASTGAHSLFATLSPKDKALWAPTGFRSITVSCHAKADAWFSMGKEKQDATKQRFIDEVLSALNARFPGITSAEKPIVNAATPRTWQDFTGRSLGRVGGLPFTWKTLRRFYPTGFTSDPTLVRVGDTVFPGQSVVATAWGARRIAKELARKLLAIQ